MSQFITVGSETVSLRRVLVRETAAFAPRPGSEDAWDRLGFTAPPDPGRAGEEHEAFVALLEEAGAAVERLADAPGLTLDSIYVRDASVVCAAGSILCRMGKATRRAEPDAHEAAYRALGIPVLGRIAPPGRLEGGDVVWLDARTVAVGEGYRTNEAGIDQLERLVEGVVDEVIRVPLPHWRGPDDVFHLMSVLSPVAEDRALVYSPLLPVPFRDTLLGRGVALIEVPDGEFESQGANVLALAPGRCLALEGNPATRRRLEAAGIEVTTYRGEEISLKGRGGPTCLTRPLVRG